MRSSARRPLGGPASVLCRAVLSASLLGAVACVADEVELAPLEPPTDAGPAESTTATSADDAEPPLDGEVEEADGAVEASQPAADLGAVEPGTEARPARRRARASKPDRSRRGVLKRAPAWARRGSHEEDGASYAVGLAGGISNPALARRTAENRARAALARHLEGRGESFSATRMAGIEIVDVWTDPVTGAMVARARRAASPAATP